MNIIPAIDIRGGKVVRLKQGSYKDETIYSDSPLEVAKRWDSFGIELIHVVDLDGALEGKPKNLKIVEEISKNIKAKIELGGGIRGARDIETALAAGADKVCLGTKVLDGYFLETFPAEFKSKVVVSIDAKDGIVYSKGWVCDTKVSVDDLVKNIERFGFKTINYTDIAKDGMMSGPNIDEIKKLLSLTKMDVVASGGVSTIEDIRKLNSIKSARLVGAIVGKALYEGTLDLGEAIKVARGINAY